MKRNIYILFFLSLFLISAEANAEIKLPDIFGENMVLQQQADAAIWGKSTENKEVKVTTSWDNKSYTAQPDSRGNWKVNVKTPKAGGPYSITISDGERLILENVMIGEVWICSGQSNMEMPMCGYMNLPVTGANKAIATSRNNKIRLFTVERNKSTEKLDDFTGEWLECRPENVADFSAVAYYFGEMLNEVLDIPVGLICSSWAGTRIEPWISENGLKDFDWVTMPDKDKKEELSEQTPAILFNAMIAPMVNFEIQGVIWYQGESNKNEPFKYEKLMTGLINDWRREWGSSDIFFFYVQIAPFDYSTWGGRWLGSSSAFLREAQLKASTATANTGMVCLMDVGEKENIHPPDKKVVGERLAYLALAKTYGIKGIEYSGPVLKEMKVEGSTVRLTFDHAEKGLTSYGKKPENFKIAGENKRFVPAEAFIRGNQVILISPWVKNPVAVRYAFEDFVVGDIFNTAGLPASSFRTDDWEIE